MRESRLSGSVEGVMSDHHSYSDFYPWTFSPRSIAYASRVAAFPIGRVNLSRQRIVCPNDLGKRLSWPVHTAEESAQMTRNCDNRYCDGLDRQAVCGQDSSILPLRSLVDEPHHPDQHARHGTHHQVHQKDAFEFLPLEFPLPRDNSSDHDRYGCERRDEQVVVGGRSQQSLLLPLRKKIKENADSKQGDGEVNQHNVLRMFGEEYGLNVERVQGFSSLTAR